jgi:hypothetical protein
MQVTASGGSGSGAVSYQVVDGSASGCAVDASSGVVTSTSPGTCVVQVTKGASGDYLAQVSPLSVVTFVATPQLSALILTSTRGVFATPLTLTTSGGSGSGAVSYRVSDGSARGCVLTSSAGELTSSSAGTCVVQVIKAASGDFEAQLSALTRVRLSANTPVAPIVRLVRARDGHAIVSLTDSDLGGDPETAVQYSLDGGTWKSAIRLGHGHVEITGLHALSQVSLRLRVYTAAGHSAPSVPVHFVAR